MQKFLFLSILFLFFCIYKVFPAGTAGSNANLETLFIVNMPTAGVIPNKTIAIESLFMSEGAMLVYVNYSPLKRFNLGLSYEANKFIGADEISFQKYPGLQIAYRIFDEKLKTPAVLIGINTQGRGLWSEKDVRHTDLSPGVYIAVSKNFKWDFGYIALHGGVNYSFDQNTTSKRPNIYLGFEQSIGSRFAVNAEFNSNINENKTFFRKDNSFGTLNTRVRFSITEGATINLDILDIFGSSSREEALRRNIGIDCVIFL